MRLEVIVGSDDPIIFPINSNKISIGSSETCDIVLISEGVSRKHISIMTEADKFFISDLGSTNGTYMNESRLVPGRKVEFTSFFPVRLGHNVLISLLSDEDEDYSSLIGQVTKERTSPSFKRPQVNTDSTVTISLSELKKTSTIELVKARDKKRVEIKKTKAKQIAKKKEKSHLVPFLALCVFATGVYYNFFVDKEVAPEIIETVGRVEPIKTPSVPVENILLISNDELPSKEQFELLISNPKCIIDVEKYFCDLLNIEPSTQFGAVKIGTTINILVDATQIFNEVDTIVKIPTEQSEESLKQYETLRKESAVYLFFLRSMPSELDSTLVGDDKLIIGLYDKKDEQFVLSVNAGILAKAYKELRPELKENFHSSLKDSGIYTFTIPHRYYRTF